MKTKLIYICLFILLLVSKTESQEIPDDLQSYVFENYLSIENISNGGLFKLNDTTMSKYRFIFCIELNFNNCIDGSIIKRVEYGLERVLYLERIDYSLKGPSKFIESPTNARICDKIYMFDPIDFWGKGEESPTDIETSVVVEKWKSKDSAILKVGRSSYLLDFHKYPDSCIIYPIDNNDNIINTGLPKD